MDDPETSSSDSSAIVASITGAGRMDDVFDEDELEVFPREGPPSYDIGPIAHKVEFDAGYDKALKKLSDNGVYKDV